MVKKPGPDSRSVKGPNSGRPSTRRGADRPTHARLEIHDAGGAKHVIVARALASFPLAGRAWIEETHARFEWDTPTGRREGHGVMEHVWRAGPLAMLQRTPRVAHDLWRALRR